MAAKKRVAKPKLEAKPEPRIAKGPTTKSGTLSAADRKPSVKEQVNEAHSEIVKAKAAKAAPVVVADPELGPGLVEHGVGLGRHRPEDGPVPAEGTVILVTPERGA